MFDFAPRLHSIAISVAFAAGAILFTTGPTPAQMAEPAFSSTGMPTLAPMLEQVTPAAVNIAVASRASEQDNPLYSDPAFRRFLFLGNRQGNPIWRG
ncbi:hypothetical protein [Rhizobium sp. GR12]|uniref:hypothetical protein n=1 Tax=Rhizobium sp. GR12 TaxID=3053925 RepID=UPI002FBE0058